jgi:ribosome production factor 2
MALKRPHAIAFNKKNQIYPFDDTSTSISSLEFWANKNDASMFVVGQTTKKRPHGLTFVRMYDGRVLDMTEVGVESWVGLADFKVLKKSPLPPGPCIDHLYLFQDPKVNTRSQTIDAFRFRVV